MQEDVLQMRSQHVLSAPGVGSELCLLAPRRSDGDMLLWLPALGVPARHYQPLAAALREHGVGIALHEWRGIGSSSVRAGRHADWGYRELLEEDLPAAIAACRRMYPEARLILGGHSLGGQLACLAAGLCQGQVDGVVLVASGTPHWRGYRPWGVPLYMLFAVVPWMARLCGHFPGRRLGFGGNEACGVMADWARSGRSGHYRPRGVSDDLEHALAGQRQPLLAFRLADDRLGPAAALRNLLRKMPHAPSETQVIDDHLLGTRADHFAWMKTPQAMASRMADWLARLE